MLTQIDHRHLVRLLSIGRVGLGVAMLLAPRRALRLWLGDVTHERSAHVAIRALGVRDIVLGLGTLRALDRGDAAVREWVTGGAAADGADAAATLLAYPSLPRRGRAMGLLVATGAAVVGIVARDRMG